MAAAYLNQAIGKAKGFWNATNSTQRIFLFGIVLAVFLAFFLMIYFMSQANYQVLYSNLFPEDASRVVEILKSNKVKYKLEDNGATILVPEEQVYDLRLQVAGEGSVVGQGVGFEIFDELKVGQTEFVQKINYQRALQGELSRTISEFPQVEKARVHLVIPHRSLFIEEQKNPSASVVVTLKSGERMEDKQVQSIVNLVSMSVEGLEKSQITVADTSGKVLYSPRDKDSLEGMTTTQLEYKHQLQSNLERQVEELLYPVVGPGRVIAKINADLDFSQRTIHKELFDPDSAVVRSEQRSEESTDGASNLESGVPESNFRGEGITGGLSQQQSSRETRTTNFEINKEEQSIVASVGELQRLSVAVIVDGTHQLNQETGEYSYIPRPQEELQRIEQLVRSAVGYESARGDVVQVTSVSFGEPEIMPELGLGDMLMDYATRMGKPILNALLIFLFLLIVVRPIVLALIRPKVEGELVEGLEGLPEAEERLALLEGDEDEFDALDALKKIEDIKAHAFQISEQNMEQAVGILRSWLKQQEGARFGAAA